MVMQNSEPQIKEQGAVDSPAKGAFVYRLNDGRKIAYTATLRVEDLSKRKGGGFDPVYHRKDGTFWLTPEEGSDTFGVVIRETGSREAFIGIAEPKKPEKKDATIITAPATSEGSNGPSGETTSPANPS